MRNAKRQMGYTYLGLLALLVVFGMTALKVAEVGELRARRRAESELIFVGAEFRRAFLSYSVLHSQGDGAPVCPPSLDDLVQDDTLQGVRRHLRRLYSDPMAADMRWGEITNAQGRICAVYSRATGVPSARFIEQTQQASSKSSVRRYGDIAFGIFAE